MWCAKSWYAFSSSHDGNFDERAPVVRAVDPPPVFSAVLFVHPALDDDPEVAAVHLGQPEVRHELELGLEELAHLRQGGGLRIHVQ